jgi:hypothetical protein
MKHQLHKIRVRILNQLHKYKKKKIMKSKNKIKRLKKNKMNWLSKKNKESSFSRLMMKNPHTTVMILMNS